MPIDSQAFRDVLRHFPAGVTVVTVATPGFLVITFSGMLDPP